MTDEEIIDKAFECGWNKFLPPSYVNDLTKEQRELWEAWWSEGRQQCIDDRSVP